VQVQDHNNLSHTRQSGAGWVQVQTRPVDRPTLDVFREGVIEALERVPGTIDGDGRIGAPGFRFSVFLFQKCKHRCKEFFLYYFSLDGT